MKKTFESMAELKALVGEEVAVSDWEQVTQQRIDRFAEATGDFQWIHCDPERAALGPFGTTIAHGYLTLSMLPMFMERSIELKNVRMGVNYGLNRVRFTAPVPVDSELRARIRLLSVEELPDNGAQMVWQYTVERKGSDRPVCVAESISRRYA
ncbi:MAG: MaoC family dehydratase [Gammaproteobacteria bacterium]|jgi:acyl dehydratase